jgi:hypothetical protein
MSTPTVRWNDTINYLNQYFPHFPGLGDHINGIVTLATMRDAISNEISLNALGPLQQMIGGEEKRRALRGLLLCQRVYYSNLWAGGVFVGSPNIVPDNFLAGNWKTASLNHWGMKNETQIRDGIALFMPLPHPTRQDLQVAAHTGPQNQISLRANVTLSRTAASADCYGQGHICYVGVIGWLLKSGWVSIRWVMRCCPPEGESSCDVLFGKSRVIWRQSIKPEDEDRCLRLCNDLRGGFIVHVWTLGDNWNGHWFITNGDGTMSGVNNGDVESHERMGTTDRPKVRKDYTNFSTVYEQVHDYGKYDEITKQWKTAMIVLIDPATMPRL